MESNKERLDIVDCSISQTSLEQVGVCSILHFGGHLSASSLVTIPHTPCLLSCHHPSHTLPPLLSLSFTHLAFHSSLVTIPHTPCLLSCHHPSHTLPPLLSPSLTHLASSLVTIPHTPCLLSCHHPSHTLPSTPLLSPSLIHLASSLVTIPHTPCLPLLSCHHPIASVNKPFIEKTTQHISIIKRYNSCTKQLMVHL